jgi:hypothetical protein
MIIAAAACTDIVLAIHSHLLQGRVSVPYSGSEPIPRLISADLAMFVDLPRVPLAVVALLALFA